ncbi:MAG TPA: acyltransferase, partial [Gemmatimonadaceae bacterium]|nr:acyltransferase [Gemmatimonadaceae bacterium]
LLFEEHKRSGRLSVGPFLLRRGLKIYPPFWLLIAVTVALSLSGWWQPFAGQQLGAELVFVQNYLPGLWPHTWSLAVEEHFYLLLPLLLVVLLRLSRTKGNAADPFSRLPVVFLGVAMTCLALRLATSFSTPYQHTTHLFPTHLRIDSLLLGVVLSYFRHYRTDWFFAISARFRPAMIAAGIACFAPAFVFQLETTRLIPSVGVALFAVGGGLLLWGLAGVEPRRSRIGAAAAFVGARSYSIYLWHMAVTYWGLKLILPRVPGLTWTAYALGFFVGSIAVGLLMHAAVEAPMLRIRDRLIPSRSRKPLSVPGGGRRPTPIAVPVVP